MTADVDSSRSELMFLGKECHHPACHLNDFLPFSCPACHQSYCQPHFLPSQHACTAPLPPSMVDRIAPQCPLCHEIVPTTSSKDPNEAVDRHILGETCTGLPGGEERKKAELKAKKERGEVCYRKGCSKILVVKMKCDACGRQFCPTHRHASSHTCTPNNSRTATPQPPTSAAGTSKTAAGATSAKAAMSRFLPKSSGPSSSGGVKPIVDGPPSGNKPVQVSAALDARAAAAAAAMKRAGQDVKANVPFVKTKTEKRADAELQSTIQSLKTRHERGLLSKTEELKYAELVGKKEADRRKGGKDKDGCVVC